MNFNGHIATISGISGKTWVRRLVPSRLNANAKGFGGFFLSIPGYLMSIFVFV